VAILICHRTTLVEMSIFGMFGTVIVALTNTESTSSVFALSMDLKVCLV
jgi:hypothetical protein